MFLDKLDAAIHGVSDFISRAARDDSSFFSYESIIGEDGKKQSVKVLDTKAISDIVSAIDKLRNMSGSAEKSDGDGTIVINGAKEDWCM